mgnify:CR=1 FL=1
MLKTLSAVPVGCRYDEMRSGKRVVIDNSYKSIKNQENEEKEQKKKSKVCRIKCRSDILRLSQGVDSGFLKAWPGIGDKECGLSLFITSRHAKRNMVRKGRISQSEESLRVLYCHE